MLHLEDIRVQLGSFRLRVDSLHVRPGECRVLLGPTGTGKTVLLETIAGLHEPRQGRIILNGHDITRTVPEKRHLGVVYQEYALFPHLTVFENIAFGLRLRRVRAGEIDRAIREMADFLAIGHILDRLPHNLSGGERQRAALARALVLHPHLLLLDEPLSAVDLLTRDRLRRELQRVHRELGITIVHITHDLSEAFFLADRMTVMRDGNLLQEGSPEGIAGRPASRFVAELLGMKNFIPARVTTDGTIAVQDLGPMDPGLLETPPARTGEEILITFPPWAVELQPAIGEGRFWWQGSVGITDVQWTDSQVELELALSGMTRVHTTLSRRETGRLASAPQVGSEVRIGIAWQFLHWLPAAGD